MTKHRICATDKGLPVKPKPVTDWQNQQVKGLALCADKIFRDHQDDTDKLRAQQAEYISSLPTDPNAIIDAAQKVLQQDYEAFPSGIDFALNALVALEEMAKHGGDICSYKRKSMGFLAEKAVDELTAVVKDLNKVSDILSNRNIKRPAL